MKRIAHNALKKWKNDKKRKPLVLRGARQVGKTTLARAFGETFEHYVEINFEQSQPACALFEGDLDAHRLLKDLSLLTGEKILPGKTLLFLDEAQVCPRALLALRYFYEKLPELHVIAAGSLLDFAIDAVGVPVGRVSFMYLYPMSFIEFLWALSEPLLVEEILQHDVTEPLNAAVHQKLLRLFGEYLAIGGMPEAVATWRDTQDYPACLQIHHDIIAAYQQDMQKYAKQSQIKYVDFLFQQIPQQIGKRFSYAVLSDHYRKRELAPAFELLRKAHVIHPVTHSSGFGLPLGAGAKPDVGKVMLLDIALTQALLGHQSQDWILDTENAFLNKGALAEAFVGQELLAYGQSTVLQKLYYWQREERSSQAEVDYLAEKNGVVIPIEVKAGKGTTLKSMHQFLQSHPDSPYGVRYSTQNYHRHENIHSYPLYAVVRFFAELFAAS